MKCIINCCTGSPEWVENFVNDKSAYLLKLVNKPLIEYYIDFCTLAKISEINIVSDEPCDALTDYLGNGDQWGVKISHSIIRKDDSFETVFKKNKGFLQESDFIYINGFVFLHYDKNAEIKGIEPSEKSKSLKLDDSNNGLFVFKYGSDYAQTEELNSNVGLGVSSINTVSEYFILNMKLLSSESSKYVFPGYSREESAFIGQNVGITKHAQIEKPVSVGNNVRLIDAVIGKNSIIGANSLIDKNTKVENAIVYDDTYIGSGLEIIDKIIIRKKIIDPDSGESIDVPDDFIVSKIESSKSKGKIEKLIFWCVALILAIVQLPFFIILRLLVKAESQEYMFVCSKEPYETDDIKLLTKKSKSPITSLFFRLSLHKFFLLLSVLRGKLHLVGNTPLEDNSENKMLLNDMVYYKPGVFTINEMLNGNKADIFEKNINDLYYSNNCSFSLSLSVLVKSLIKNIMGS